jgi:hypothetical protein
MPAGGRHGFPGHRETVVCRENVAMARDLASRLLELARLSRESCHHDGCRLLTGVIHDSSLKILNLTEWWSRELEALELAQETGSLVPSGTAANGERGAEGKNPKG